MVKYRWLRERLLAETESRGLGEMNFHFKSLLQWYSYEKTVEEIACHIKQKGRILDVGCGFGHVASMLNMEGYRAVGVDVETQSQYTPIWRSLPGDRFLVVADGCKLPFQPSVFDGVVCHGVLEHVGDEGLLLEDCMRVLKKRGFFFCYALPNATSPTPAIARAMRVGHHHERSYSRRRVLQLFEDAGFVIIGLGHEGMIPAQLGRISRTAGNVTDILHRGLYQLDRLLLRTPLHMFATSWKIIAVKK